MIAHVGELVREHASQLFLVDDLHQPLGHRDRGVVFVPTGCERVGLLPRG